MYRSHLCCCTAHGRKRVLPGLTVDSLDNTPSPCQSKQVIQGVGYDGRPADLWSAGVCLYCMLAGFLPFEADQVGEKFDKIQVRGNQLDSYVFVFVFRKR